MALRALARVNLAAIERNVSRLRAGLAGGAGLCAVVKGDGYGHGAAHCARAALAGGARCLAVATAQEAADLRSAGANAPVLVMGALSAEELPIALAADAELVAWTERFVDEVARAAQRTVRMHVKLDTGMGRLGTRDHAQALSVAQRAANAPAMIKLGGAMTHFATADEDPEFLQAQLEAFAPFAQEIRSRYPGAVLHAANSAATMREPRTHYDLVRCGIAIYGCDPMNVDPTERGLEPALELESYVAAVKQAQPRDSVGYGRRFIASAETWIGTLPIGYADGFRRALTNNCDVLIGARRYPVIGTVSMDNITVDLGTETDVQPGTRAVIVGRDGGEVQTAEDIARRIDTISYEIVCGITRRVPRVYHRDGEPVV